MTQLVGIGQAKRMIMNCEQIKADEALRIGLVEVVVKPEEVHDYAFKTVSYTHLDVYKRQ